MSGCRILMIATIVALISGATNVIAAEPAVDYVVHEEWVSQPLDHKNPGTENFRQQVWIVEPNDAGPNARIFFVLGNQNDVTDREIVKYRDTYGRPENTVFVIAEHRGYGQSIPDGDNTVPHYLKIGQALADYSVVLGQLAARWTGRRMVAGYSYGGALAIQFARDFPQAMDVILASSAPVRWPFLIPEYSRYSRAHLGDALANRLYAIHKNLKATAPYDDRWRQRELLSATISGLTQRRNVQHLIPVISVLSYLPTSWFAAILDTLVPADGHAWPNSRRPKTLTGNMARNEKSNWYMWKYQQCHEVGAFFSENPFSWSREDHIADCRATFGTAPPYAMGPKWDGASMIPQIEKPLVIVAGGRDPWAELGVKADHQFDHVIYISDPEGFHCPDREDPVLGRKLMNVLLKS